MKKISVHRFGLFFCFISTIACASAQVVLDNSFGNVGSLNGPNFKIPDTLGKTVGPNLFHSFSDFSLRTGESATFTGPDSIQNILGRVTGSEISEIDGLIKSEIANANLYLLNPNGFLFGKNASVSVDGAFTLSTKESIELGDGGSFNASNPDQSVFTSAAPDAFGFLGENPGGAIKFSGSKLILDAPVNLIGGDVRLEDSAIYSKSKDVPTGVSVVGDNLSIVDSQIRNRSAVEVEGEGQGVLIELRGDLEIMDTTITEEDGSGVDRGDFIDEIGSDVPFASKVGILAVTEGLEAPAPISINAKDAKITGGGVYSVNLVTEEKIFKMIKAPRIDIKAKSLRMEQGTLEVATKMAGVKDVEFTHTITLGSDRNTVKFNRPIFVQENFIEVYLNGKRQSNSRHFTLNFNSNGALEQVVFEKTIPEGAKLEFVMQPNLTKSNHVAANLSGDMSLGKNSKVKSGQVYLKGESLFIDDSHVFADSHVDIQSATQLSVDHGSSIKSDFFEEGNLHIAADTFRMDGRSTLEGSSKILIDAPTKVDIMGESNINVGWADARGAHKGSKDILWDSKNGKVVDQNSLSPKGRFKDASAVSRKLASWYGDQVSFNVIDINQPLDYNDVPHVSIESNAISVDHGSLTGDSGGVQSAIRVQSLGDISISGESALRQFDLIELNAKSVDVDKGIKIESKINKQDFYTGFIVVNSDESANLSGGTILGSLVVNSGGDITVTDMDIGHGNSKVSSNVFKLDADGKIYFGPGELGVNGTVFSRMLNIEGSDIHIKGYGLMSQSGMGIIGSNRVELEGPAGINTTAVGSQELVIKAPDVSINDGVNIFAQLMPQQGFMGTGRIRISGFNDLNLQGSRVEAGSPQLFGETPMVSLSGGNITLDNVSLSQYCHYDNPKIHGEIYAMSPDPLNGYKTTKINATGSFNLINKSRVFINIGRVIVDAEDISIEDSEVLSRNVWASAEGWVGRIKLNARNDIILSNAKINSETISSGTRAEILLIGNNLEANNAEVRIYDERKGKEGQIQLNFEESIKMDNSQVLSVGSSHLAPDTNGNKITIKSNNLNMKDSLITGMVEGDGKRGVTELDISGEMLLEGSYVGGLEKPLNLVEQEALLTDGTFGEVRNLIAEGEMVVPSDLGAVHGANLFHSFEKLNIGTGQTLVMELPEGVSNVFLRVTGGKKTILNGVVVSSREGGNITLINEKGFELGPDVDMDDFSGIRLGAVDKLLFKDGGAFGGTSEAESLSGAEANFNIRTDQLKGEVKLMGALLRGNKVDDEGGSEIGLFGEKIDMISSGVVSVSGADINLIANKVDLRQATVLHALSPVKDKGGNINIKSRELQLKGSGVRTTSLGGQGGDINIDVDNSNIVISAIESNNYFGENSREKFKTGNIYFNSKESLSSHRPLIALRSNTRGGTGNISINGGDLILDGLGDFATEIWVMAYGGDTGQLEINADAFDAKLVRIINVAMADKGELDQALKEGYGDISINANEMKLHNIMIQNGTKRTDKTTTLGDINIMAENDMLIKDINIINSHASTSYMGGDITFSAENILNGFNSEKIDPTDYPSIAGTGSLSFLAEGKLELGRMKFSRINTSPSRDLITLFKGNNISLGMDLGDGSVGVDSVVFDYPDNSDKDHRVVVSSKSDVHFLSGVNLTTPALSLSARNFDINNSKITVGGTFGSRIDVQDTLSLRAGSTIESLSPSGKSDSTVLDPVSIDISSQQLLLEPDSYILATNHGDDIKGNRPIADLNIQAGEISLEDAIISTQSTNAAKAGDLDVAAAGIVLDKDSRIGSYSFSRGESGGITIGSSRFTMSEGSAVESGLNQSILNRENDPYASGNSGDIQIASEILNLEDGSYIRNAQIDTALPGDVSITSDEIKISRRSFISTESVPLYQIDFSNRTEVDQNGSVSIKTKSLDLSESSYVKTTTVIPKRNAGDIIIEADAVSLSGRSSMLSNTEPNKFETELGLTGLDYGNAGRLEIKTDSLQLADQSKISSDSFTSGDGGDVTLTATDLALANRSAIYAGALSQGEGGRITIDTAAMNLSGKSAVVADVRDSGNGGEVSVKAAALDMDESLIYGSTSGEGVGSRISVDTDSITLKHGARIESAASAGGAAGELVVQSGIVTITGMGEGFDPKDIEGGETGERVASGLLTSTEGSGDAGTIELKADQLEMQQGLIGSASTGEGAAGSVMLRLARGLSLGQGASVSVSSSQADGGDIEIESAGEMRFVRSELTASAAKDGGSIRLLGAGSTYIRDSRMSAEAGQDGGNITISKPDLLFMNRGQLSANAVRGHGGYIQVVAEAFLPSIDTAITASSEYGVQGVVEIDTVETDIGSGLVVLPEQLEDSSVNLAERCALRLQGDVSSFFLNGQGGIPVWSKDTYLPTVIVPELDNTDRSRGQEDSQ
ncbi:filamentous hemagglutinin N-terminal domain-containing protein [bacterium]|nr:filamentous hemagglutinin N-terminal domain-containing protein [bacterium]